MIQRVVERAQSTRRSDDNEATVATAIARYNETCKAEVVSHYESLNQCTRISAGGDVDDGYQQSRDAAAAVRQRLPGQREDAGCVC